LIATCVLRLVNDDVQFNRSYRVFKFVLGQYKRSTHLKTSNKMLADLLL